MNNGELQAISIADKYKGDVSQMDKLKKLGEEYAEFIEAVLLKPQKDVLEEAGDMMFLILHILHKVGIPSSKINMTNLVMNAADKMEQRFNTEVGRSQMSDK